MGVTTLKKVSTFQPNFSSVSMIWTSRAAGSRVAICKVAKEDQRSVKYFPGTSRHLLIGSHLLVQKSLQRSLSAHVIANPARAGKLFIWFLT